MIVVSNATPVITLAKIGHFDLLQKLFTKITISQDVWTEVAIKGAGRSGSFEVQRGWIQVAHIAN